MYDITKSISDSLIPEMNMDDMVHTYSTLLSALMDIHAPEVKKTITVRPNTQWHSEPLRAAKRNKRQAERKWRKSGLEVDHQMFRELCSIANQLNSQAKLDYYSSKITDCDHDQKAISAVSKKLLGSQNKNQLPSHASSQDLANKFSDFFLKKIGNIRSSLSLAASADNTRDSSIPRHDDATAVTLSMFEPATEEEVLAIIKRSPTKSCELDPIPTHLLKLCTQ